MADRIKAIGLVSGGLDSILALKVIHGQGVEVIALKLYSGFDTIKRPPRNNQAAPGLSSETDVCLRRVTEQEGIQLEFVDMSEGYLDLLHAPAFGYGKNVNPCVDCHIHMLKIAHRKMEEYGAQFVFTGEVLGQRPMSQLLPQLTRVATQSGLKGLLVRPLSAQLLPETIPEQQGWLKREKLLAFHGRNRKPQMKLAEDYGINDFPSPAGGCSLTDPGYALKVKDLWKYLGQPACGWQDYQLLKIGRHLRINADLKMIIGRHEAENLILENYRENRILIEVEDLPGPIALLESTRHPVEEETRKLAAQITARYSDAKNDPDPVRVRLEENGSSEWLYVSPSNPEEVSKWVIS